MSTHEAPEIFRLKSSPEYLVGLLIFPMISVALGIFAFSGQFWRGLCFGAATMLAGGSLIHFLFIHLRLVVLTTSRISVARGLWGPPKHHALADVVDVRLQYTEGGQSVVRPLLEIDLPSQSAPEVKRLSLLTRQGDVIALSSHGYDHTSFRRLAAELWGLAQAGWLHLGDSPAQAGVAHPHPEPETPESEERRQIAQALADCQAYLANDQALAQSLRQNLFAAHASVYRPHLAPAGTDLSGLALAYAGQVANGQVTYFLASDFLPDASLADRELAQNLIATAQQHLALAQGRIEVYQKMADQLQRLATEQARRQQLQQIADQLGQLQPLSLERANHQDTFTLDLSALAEAQRLSAQLEAEHDLTRAEALRQYAELLKGHFGR
jgi:hypothetical protein